MNDIEQLLAIAEALGFEPDKPGAPDSEKVAGYWHDRKRRIEFQLPNYLIDLNACHEMEQTLTDEEYEVFGKHLCVMADDEQLKSTKSARLIVSASGRWRSKAFLKTKGKWK